MSNLKPFHLLCNEYPMMCRNEFKEFIAIVTNDNVSEGKFAINDNKMPRDYDYKFVLKFLRNNEYIKFDSYKTKIEGNTFIIKKC